MAPALDAILPQFAQRELHHATVAATQQATWDAVRATTVGELPVARVLVALRGLAGRVAGGGAAPAVAPEGAFVEQAVAAGFGLLVDDAPRTLVLAACGQPWKVGGGELLAPADAEALRAFDRTDHVRMALSIELAPDVDDPRRTRLSTETRVQPVDAQAARAFGRYWWLVRPGSGLIRSELLRAIRKRAERG